MDNIVQFSPDFALRSMSVLDGYESLGKQIEEPKLLRIPSSFRSVEEALSCALKLQLSNILILSELENGNLVLLSTKDMTLSQTKWICDKAKSVLMEPNPSVKHTLTPDSA